MSNPDDVDVSKLRFYSIGRAANNKALVNAETGQPERNLEVTPIEHLGDMDGELVSLPFESSVSGTTPVSYTHL